jgi:hypothetical protein
MFCARCGKQIPDATEICQLCGREATVKVDPPPPAPKPAAAVYGQINWPSEPETRFPPARNPALRGVGGWLLFFCIALTILVPLIVFIQAWSADFGMEVLPNIVWAAFGVFVGTVVWNVHPRTFLLLWIYFGVTALLLGLAIVDFILAEEPVDMQIVTVTFRGLMYTVVWFLYFKQSDRVQATFGRNL